jgi:hypothetical protein
MGGSRIGDSRFVRVRPTMTVSEFESAHSEVTVFKPIKGNSGIGVSRERERERERERGGEREREGE